jgi:hypothetical protein
VQWLKLVKRFWTTWPAGNNFCFSEIMSETIQWQSNAIDVQARLVPRFLWTTASIDVLLNGQCILKTGGQMKLTGSYSTTFSHSEATHKAELSWGVGGLFSFPYKLRIDDNLISDSRVRVRNWPLGLIIWIGVAGVIFSILHSIR